MACAGGKSYLLTNGKWAVDNDDSASSPCYHHRPPAEHTASPAPKPKPAPALARIGQPVRAGVFTFIVSRWECGITRVTAPPIGGQSQPGDTSTPQHGQFCIAVVNELNVSHQPQPVPFDATMQGTNNSTYDNDVDPFVLTHAQLEFLGSNYNVTSEVNPGTTNQDIFIWDVPSSVRAVSVTIDSGFGVGSGTVNVQSGG